MIPALLRPQGPPIQLKASPSICQGHFSGLGLCRWEAPEKSRMKSKPTAPAFRLEFLLGSPIPLPQPQQGQQYYITALFLYLGTSDDSHADTGA